MTSFLSSPLSMNPVVTTTSSPTTIDHVIQTILRNQHQIINPENLLDICNRSIDILKRQPVFLELKAPINVCGDIHGQINDLIRIFQRIGIPGSTPYLFLGDYVDRGENSLDVITLLLAFKIKYPYNIFLLRGNHECHDVNEIYSFKEECIFKYGELGNSIWRMFNTVFQWLPLVALVENKILCVHGGLSQRFFTEMSSLDQLHAIQRDELYTVAEDGLVCDLLWADPNESDETQDWQVNERGCSFMFGKSVVNHFCRKFNVELIVRAHEVQNNGYKFFSDKFVTVFSASNYCGEYGNNGAVLKIARDLTCLFEIFPPSTDSHTICENVIHRSMPILMKKNLRRQRARTNSPKPKGRIFSIMKAAEDYEMIRRKDNEIIRKMDNEMIRKIDK